MLTIILSVTWIVGLFLISAGNLRTETFQGHTYLVLKDQITFDEAVEVCREKLPNGYPVVLDSEQEKDFIESIS